MTQRTKGFTIIEIVVVIVVVGILVALTAIGMSHRQSIARDAQRESSAQVIAESLETYFQEKGEYPPCPALTDTGANVTTTVLRGLNSSVLVAPQDTTGATNSIKCTDLTALSQPDFFAYIGDATPNCQTGDACLFFTLKYKQEASNSIGVIRSRHNVSIATSGTPTLTATANGFTTATVSWTAIKNSTSYTLQRATNSAFTQNVVNTTVVGVNTSVSGLSYDTTYYFRVRAHSDAGEGQWSATKSISTWNLATPTISASTVSSTSFRGSWGAISRATGYVAQCSSNGTTWSTGCETNVITPTSFTFTGASQGVRYYVRVKAVAVNGGTTFSSNWSNVANTITTIDNPAAYGMYSDNTLPNWNWLNARSDAVCPAGTTASYDWYANGGFWVSGSQYRAVSYALSWNTSVTLQVASRCTTALTSSGFVWANNSASMDLPWPTATTWLPGDGKMYWGGTCPKWTTSNNFYWRTNGRLNASGNTWQSAYSNPAWWYTGSSWWGNGRAWVTLSCTGPWGTASVDANSMYGPGCVPTATVAECWQ